MTTTNLSTFDWDFLRTVARAAFANPFGERREELDILIGGVTPHTPKGETLAAVMARVARQVEAMRPTGTTALTGLSEEQRETLRVVLLFHVFHRHAEAFDRLIQAQLQRGDTPCRVAFAQEALQALGEFGFTDQEAVRYFAVFYQLRRAFHFINTCLVGSSAAMIKLRKHLWSAVFTHDIRWFETRLWDKMEEFSVLLLGETGTGKGAAAAAIGRSGFIPFDRVKSAFSESFTKNFVAINLSQFSEGLLESELFGHRKGAFTGAVDNHEGIFSRCPPHGIILLDEIGDVGVPVQIKLLQVLQERVFFPVGSHEPRRFSGRVIAATNRSLTTLRREGRFRDDFYYRLCSDVVTIPTLRQRLAENPNEIEALLGSILTRIAGGVSTKERQLVRRVLERDLGKEYPWPGNVRELEQAVKRVILTGHYQGEAMEPPPTLVGPADPGLTDDEPNADTLLARYCALLYQRFGTYEEVARRTRLDRRTVKKYLAQET